MPGFVNQLMFVIIASVVAWTLALALMVALHRFGSQVATVLFWSTVGWILIGLGIALGFASSEIAYGVVLLSSGMIGCLFYQQILCWSEFKMDTPTCEILEKQAGVSQSRLQRGLFWKRFSRQRGLQLFGIVVAITSVLCGKILIRVFLPLA
jgi:hypothetical protein